MRVPLPLAVVCRCLLTGLVLLLTGCGGAVVFAPIAADTPDQPARYTHPSGAFTIDIPPAWTVYPITTPPLAAAAFTPPDTRDPVLMIGVVRLADAVTDLTTLIDRYQTLLRADADTYAETARAPLADGSWRVSGARLLPDGERVPVNTFFVLDGDHVLVMEARVPDDARLHTALTRALAAVTIADRAALPPSTVDALAELRPAALAILHVRAWTAADGAFFVTGEIANYGDQPAVALPIEARLTDAAGNVITGAVDTVAGVGIPADGFAPFSLRFATQPPGAVGYLLLAGSGWTPPATLLISAPVLTWTDALRTDEFGRLVVDGTVTHTGTEPLTTVIAAATIFDAAGGVIGAGAAPLEGGLAPGADGTFTITLPQVGGSPANYLVSITGSP